MQELNFSSMVTAIAFRHDDQKIAVAYGLGNITLIDLKTGEQFKFKDNGVINAMDYKYTNRVYVGSTAGTVIEWDNGRAISKTRFATRVVGLIPYKDSYLTASSDGKFEGPRITGFHSAPQNESPEFFITVSKQDEKKIITARGWTIVSRLSDDFKITIETDPTTCLAMRPCGTMFAAGSINNVVRMFFTAGEVVYECDTTDEPTSIVFGNDLLMITGDKSGEIRIWNSDGCLFESFKVGSSIKYLILSHDQKTLAIVTKNKKVKLQKAPKLRTYLERAFVAGFRSADSPVQRFKNDPLFDRNAFKMIFNYVTDV